MSRAARPAFRSRFAGAATLLAALAGPRAWAQPVDGPYPRMAPIAEYLMDRDAEIALARSAAPPTIARDAAVLVLSPSGYETAVRGTNGFVCMVERGWVGALDWPEFWNPKVRGADCLNPAAARSVLPLALMRTTLVLAGASRAEVIERIRAAFDRGDLPPLEPGAMSFMLARGSYLTDDGGHNGPHVMFYLPFAGSAPWGADTPGSPIASGPYWLGFETAGKAEEPPPGLPPMRVFVMGAATWSDGSAPGGHMH